MKQTFYSNGKLLLTGEYVVLDGATGLAIPTQYGQSLEVTSSDKNKLYWKSYTHDHKIWFEAVFNTQSLTFETSESTVAKTLQNILLEAKKLNATFLSSEEGYTINTFLDFPRDWGLGTSSTLINNIAQWANVDAYTLLENSFGGSGYDIAAAKYDHPVLYTKNNKSPAIKVHLPWEFTSQLFFVHLNQKQDSKEGISTYKAQKTSQQLINTITDLTKKLLLCYDLDSFEKIINAHEKIIASIIKSPTIKERYFNDYPYAIKSLGAWGGDFILVVGNKENYPYFKEKGYNTLIPFEKMLLH